MTDWTQPVTRPLAVLTAHLGAAQAIGAAAHGTRKTVPVLGGTLEGRLRGEVLPGGGDWALVRGDGVLELDVRLTLKLEDGALVHCSYTGLRHGSDADIAALAAGQRVPPERLYFRIQPRFETGAPQWSWLNRILCIGIGERLPEGPRYHIYEVM